MTKPLDFDVVIVGGGPAGLALGIGLSRRNISALVVEKKEWPIDKACGEGLMPAGVRELEALGVLTGISDAHAHPFAGVELISSQGRSARVGFGDCSGLGIRRAALSQALFEVAKREARLVLAPRTTALRVERNTGTLATHTSGGIFASRYVVGADGLHSGMRAHIQAQTSPAKRRRYGANVHFEIPPWNTHVEVHMTDGVEAYVTPCGHNQVGVAFLWDYVRYSPSAKSSLVEECLSRFPVLAERLRGCVMVGPLQSAGPMQQKPRFAARDGVILIGDAAGYSDAITGEGVTLGLIEARLLAETLASRQSLSRFEKAQARLKQKVSRLSMLALVVARYPKLQGPTFSLLQRSPWLLQRLLTFAMS